MRVRPIPIVLALVCLTIARVAAADDAGDGATESGAAIDAAAGVIDGAGGEEGSAGEDGSSGNIGPASSPEGGMSYVTACDGALCETTTGSQCGVSPVSPGRAQAATTRAAAASSGAQPIRIPGRTAASSSTISRPLTPGSGSSRAG